MPFLTQMLTIFHLSVSYLLRYKNYPQQSYKYQIGRHLIVKSLFHKPLNVQQLAFILNLFSPYILKKPLPGVYLS